MSIHNAHPRLSVDENRIRSLVSAVLDHESRSCKYLGVVLADHERVRHLNQQFLGHDYDTDVLSFTFDEQATELDGEVYVDLDTAWQQGQDLRIPFQTEVLRYVIHGLLHLLGYDDATPEGRQVMRDKEDFFLGMGDKELVDRVRRDG